MIRKPDLLSVWDVYRLGVRLTLRPPRSFRRKVRWLLGLGRYPARLLNGFTPIDYVRYREFEFAFQAVSRYAFQARAALDIGSPKLLPLAIAHFLSRTRVHSVDILSSEVEFARDAAQHLNLSNVVVGVQDARNLEFRDDQFDLVTSVSVFEHIAPEKGGELSAAGELGRVLAGGG